MGAAEDALIGTSIEGYELRGRIGSGATGVVYRAEKDGRTFALKILNRALGHVQTLRRRFQREARALAQLDHPHIVEITDFGASDDVVFIAMELLSGITLDEALHQKPVSADEAMRIMRAILAGVAYAHEKEIVHRDLKPANVFLCDNDEVKVLDFGLAKFLSVDELSQEGTLTRRGRVVGTPAYMAPEQITGASLDVRADVYAAGTVFFELLADRRPFAYSRRAQLLRAHLFEPVPILAEVRQGLDVPDELEAILRKALAKDPDDRWESAAEMLAALDALGDEASKISAPMQRLEKRSAEGTASVVISNEERESIAKPKRRRVPAAWITAAVWVVGLGGLLGLLALAGYATTLR
ncbi:MAG: serine/threonine-protein kinase [Myxococcota bacterium]